jgi:hypothetical protein
VTDPLERAYHGLTYIRARYGNMMPEEAYDPNNPQHNIWVTISGRCVADHDHGLEYDSFKTVR